MSLQAESSQPRPVVGDSAGERVWRPLGGAVLATVGTGLLCAAVFLNLVGSAFADQESEYLDLVPWVLGTAGLVGGYAAGFGVVLRRWAVPAPFATAAGLCAAGSAGLAPALWFDQFAHVLIPVASYAAVAFLVLRWRLTGRRMLLRLPAAAAGWAAVLVFTPLVAVEAEALLYRTTQPELMDMAMLDDDAWEPVTALGGLSDIGRGSRIHYSRGEDRVAVDTIPEGVPEQSTTCEDDAVECERRDGLVLAYAGAGHLDRVFAPLPDGRTAALDWRHHPPPPDGELIELAQGVRLSDEGDHAALSRLLARG